MEKKLILIGGGGHCKSVIDVAESAGYTILGILGKPGEEGKDVLGYRVIGTDEDMGKYVNAAYFVVTVGQIESPDLRIKLHSKIEEVGGKLATIISPIAHVSRYARIGEGTVVLHQAVVNANATIGKGCIINTFANIEHDVTIGDFCHISTGVMVNGNCTIGNGVFIGSQSVVNQGVSIIDGAFVASLSAVRESLSKKGLYAGNPLRFLLDHCR